MWVQNEEEKLIKDEMIVRRGVYFGFKLWFLIIDNVCPSRENPINRFMSKIDMETLVWIYFIALNLVI